MSCNIKRIKGCEIVGSTFNGRKLSLNRDFSNDNFKAKVKTFNQKPIAEITGVKNATDVYFPFNGLENLSAGLYLIEYWGNFEDIGNELFCVEEFSVVAPSKAGDAQFCENSNIFNFVTEDVSIDIQIDATNINVDLSNYYTKSETYSKGEVDEIISEIPVVDTSNLVPYNGATQNVNIGEYYFESSQGFIKIGGTANQALTANGGVFDLNTKADLVGGKVPSSQLPSYTATDVDALKRDGSNANSNIDIGEFQLKAGQIELDQTPTQPFGVGMIRWNDTDGTAEIRLKGNNVTLQLGQELVKRVVNKSGANLLESQYKVVKIIGATGQRLSIDLAQANNELNSATTIGIVTENINNNQEGFITYNGEVNGINTTGSLQGETWEDGDVLYLSPSVAGGITKIKPTAPNHVIIVGYVEYSHAVNGKIFVKIDNGYELEELHNVTSTNYTTPIDTDSVLTFDVNNSLWKRLSWANIKSNLKTYFDTIYQTALGFIPENVANKANDLTSPDNTKYPTTLAVSTALNGKQDTLTNPITGSGANGQVAFFNGTTTQTSDSVFVWDNTNKRLGIGTNVPQRILDVNGDFRAGNLIIRPSSNLSVIENAGTGNSILFIRSGGTNPLVLNDVGGGVIIGVSATAGARLDVRAQGALSTDIAFRVRNSADTVNIMRVNGDGTLTFSNDGTNSITFDYASGTAMRMNGDRVIQRSGTSTVFGGNQDYLSLRTNSSERLGIDNNGLVSINGAPTTSAQLSINSTTRGFLPPRMTTTQRNAIASPAAGLIVYDTTTNTLDRFNGTSWNAFESVDNKVTDLNTPNNTTYPTTQAVVNENKKATITVELIDLLTTNFYAPNALRINSTALISGSGTITLKVNDVAYTLGDLITQGAKITVETTTASVYNLIGIYE